MGFVDDDWRWERAALDATGTHLALASSTGRVVVEEVGSAPGSGRARLPGLETRRARVLGFGGGRFHLGVLDAVPGGTQAGLLVFAPVGGAVETLLEVAATEVVAASGVAGALLILREGVPWVVRRSPGGAPVEAALEGGGDGVLRRAAFSPDGLRVASVWEPVYDLDTGWDHDGGAFRVHHVEDGRREPGVRSGNRRERCVAFSPDSTRTLTGSAGKGLVLRRIDPAAAPPGEEPGTRWTGGGTYLESPATLEVAWPTAARAVGLGEALVSWDLARPGPRGTYPRRGATALAAGGGLAATIGGKGPEVLDLETRRLLRGPELGRVPPRRVAFGDAGDRVAVLDGDQVLRVYDASSLRFLLATPVWPSDLRLETMAARVGSWDPLWADAYEVASGEPLVLQAFPAYSNQEGWSLCDIAPGGEVLVSATRGGRLRAFDARVGEDRWRRPLGGRTPLAVRIGAAGRSVLAFSPSSRRAARFALVDGEELEAWRIPNGPSAPREAYEFLDGAAGAALVGGPCAYRLPPGGGEAEKLLAPIEDGTRLAFRRDLAAVAILRRAGAVDLRDLATGSSRTIARHEAGTDLALSPAGDLLLVAEEGGLRAHAIPPGAG